jgi:hypothetical protein
MTMKTCLHFAEEGTEHDADGNITKMGKIIDISFVDDSHPPGLRDGSWHFTGPVSVIQNGETG